MNATDDGEYKLSSARVPRIECLESESFLFDKHVNIDVYIFYKYLESKTC